MTSIEWLDEQLQDTMHIQYGYSNGLRKIVIPIDEYMKLKQIAKEKERELIKQSCVMAIMQWHEWDKTNYLDKYLHKIEGAEIWAEDYCKELYEQIEIPEPNKM